MQQFTWIGDLWIGGHMNWRIGHGSTHDHTLVQPNLTVIAVIGGATTSVSGSLQLCL